MNVNLNEHVNAQLAEAVRRLVDEFQPERIYLFGSRARGEAAQDSDYDLLIIVSESDEPQHTRARRAYSVLWGVQLPLEVVVLTQHEYDRDVPVIASLPSRVSREGLVLYAA